jgi:hypothetical protein
VVRDAKANQIPKNMKKGANTIPKMKGKNRAKRSHRRPDNPSVDMARLTRIYY